MSLRRLLNFIGLTFLVTERTSHLDLFTSIRHTWHHSLTPSRSSWRYWASSKALTGR
jgi:hypothetical protein